MSCAAFTGFKSRAHMRNHKNRKSRLCRDNSTSYSHAYLNRSEERHSLPWLANSCKNSGSRSPSVLAVYFYYVYFILIHRQGRNDWTLIFFRFSQRVFQHFVFSSKCLLCRKVCFGKFFEYTKIFLMLSLLARAQIHLHQKM